MSSLLSFGAKNFYCFNEWVELSLELNSKVPLDVSHNEKSARILCLKGANASGKTNALKILSFLSYFCTDSFSNLKPEDEIPFESHFNNTKPTHLFAVFSVEDTEYTYEITLTNKEVITEKIYKKEKRKTLFISRSREQLKYSKAKSDLSQIKLRENASIISTANQYQKAFALKPLYDFFRNMTYNINKHGLTPEKPHHLVTTKAYSLEKSAFEFTKSILRKFDTGVKDIVIKKFLNEKKEEVLYPVFISDLGDDNKRLLFSNQSSGTQSLYNDLLFYKSALDVGGVMVFDEFDSNLHSDILPELLDLFESDETNPKKAQFIFTTHNSEIMDRVGKYRTFIFNKEDNESYCYRLDEIPGNIIRNDRSIQSLYKTGQLGGTPAIKGANT